jgi:hypothetical protein
MNEAEKNRLAKDSAPYVGCMPKEITISDIDGDLWVASCGNIQHVCGSKKSGGSSSFGPTYYGNNSAPAKDVAPTTTITCTKRSK